MNENDRPIHDQPDVPDYTPLKPKPTRWFEVQAPRVITMVPQVLSLGAYVRRENQRSPLRALVTVDFYGADGDWLHLSISRSSRLPTWADLCAARDELGYADRTLCKLLPPATHWLNVHEYTLHLFCRLDGETVPRVLWDQIGCDGQNYRKPAPFGGAGR